MHTIISIAYGLVALGILVLVHELGHFFMAKLFKVRVEEFAIGFGAPLIKFKKNKTLYKIGVLPLGGFCKMAGEDPKDKLTGAPDEFYSKPPAQRLAIIAAGSGVNYLFGLLLFIIIMAVGISQPTFSNRVSVLEKIPIAGKESVSPARQAGLRSGDEILSINGETVANWYQIQRKIITTGSRTPSALKIRRAGSIIGMKIKSVVDPETGASLIGILPFVDNTVKSVQKESPAAQAGIRPLDRIVRIDGKPVSEFHDLKEYLSDKPGRNVTVRVKRGNSLLDFRLKTRDAKGRGTIGVEFSLEEKVHINKSPNILHAVSDGFQKANNTIVEIIYGLKLLLSGQVEARKAVSGPVKIIYFAGETAQRAGLLNYLSFLATISIALAFFNLLPLPAVDGSYFLIFLVEIAVRKKLNYKVISAVQYAGLLLILGLGILIIFNDIYGLAHSAGKIKTGADYLSAIMS